MNPLVSIVIPFYNDPYVSEAIESALSQTYPNREIIVVDDGSTSYHHLLTPYRSRVRIMRKNNGGTASALNYGIKHASGKYIAWLSSDDRFYPNKIERQLQYMMERNGYISHTNFDLMDEAGHITQAGAGMNFGSAVDFYRSFFQGNSINGCTVMMKRELLKKVGYFNEDMRYTHDLDLWYRIMLAGYDMHYIPDRLTAYRRHAAMGTIRHSDEIVRELQTTNHKYHAALQNFINRVFYQDR